jgi:hypothetical protein
MQADAKQHQRPQEDCKQRGQHEFHQVNTYVGALPRDYEPDDHPDDEEPAVPAAAEHSHGFDSDPANRVLASHQVSGSAAIKHRRAGAIRCDI